MKHLLLPLLCILLLSCSKDSGDEGDNPPAKISLLVKSIYKDANGNVTSTSEYTYDSQKRLRTYKTIDNNPELNAINTYSYENGKITFLKDYADASKPLEKKIYFYNANGMVKEEEYINNSLVFINEWYHRTDGGKERRIKSPSGHLFETWYYRFASSGNIERVVLDYADNANEDTEYIFSNYDNQKRSVVSHLNSVLPGILMQIDGTKLSVPNNPRAFNQKSLVSGTNLANVKMEYTYNINKQVTQIKTFRIDSGDLISDVTLQYQDF
ncbi:hypothetical protein [Flavobacterium hibisci]|uniref:hypothetical protein n=1 Tax=Flavobacterium hibisci TaxID=1914462 RepID=UPI001CBCCD28|nr:hypothetical protein [Flavobacterium hibisci]MBZ4041372.1 hypothetical protein [Flavobacterium hibisci]